MNEVIYPVYDSGELHVSISSGNSKMGNIPGFNTLPGCEPLTLKDGRVLTNIVGTCGDLCKDCAKKCYAVRYAKRNRHIVIPAYAANTIILRTDPEKLRREIHEYCKKNIVKYFRFHTSGELESLEQLELYAKICEDNPDVTFYIYTKAFALLWSWFCKLNLEEKEVPSNFVINLSEWGDNLSKWRDRAYFDECNIFVYDEKKSLKGVHCPATDKNGHETGVTCAQCRRCMKHGHVTLVYPH